jgi:hypothetical protein
MVSFDLNQKYRLLVTMVLKIQAACIFVLCGMASAYAFEPIPITISNTMDKVIFDGKWTHEIEWKASSLNTYFYNDTQIILRSAHQENFVYIFLDPIYDNTLDKLDYAIVCFDTSNNKSERADLDDYCFMTYLEGNDAFTYQGGSNSDEANSFVKTTTEGFIAKGAISDANDRYTPVPHPSYEFRIPTDLIGRQSVYGFYFLVYDESTNKTYTYPQNLDPENFVSSPDKWGEIYSPDKSLPEFGVPILSMILSITSVIVLRMKKVFSQA